MKAFSLLLRDILPSASGCPDPVAEFAVLRASQHFLRQARAWRETLDTVTTIDGVLEYDLNLPPNTELVRIEAATLGGNALDIARPDTLRRLRRYVYTPDGTTLQLLPNPGDGAALAIDASLTLGEAATGLPDPIFNRYAELIARGALGRLLQQPLKPYTNAPMGLALWSAFESDCDTVKVAIWRGLSNNCPRAVANFF